MDNLSSTRSSLAAILALFAAGLLLPHVASAAPSLISPPSTETISAQGGTVAFTFSEPMDTSGIDITWEGEGIDPAAFSCQWQDQIGEFSVPAYMLHCTYEGGLPPGVEVSYTLNAGGSGVMKSTAGEALPETSGSFVTPDSAQSNNLCLGITPGDSASSAVLMKMVNYVQSGSSDPVFDLEEKASVFAVVRNSTDVSQEVTGATLGKPDGSSTALKELSFSVPEGSPVTSDMASQFFLSTTEPPDVTFPTFESEAALNASFPDGLYTLDVDLASGGSAQFGLPLQPPSAFPTPTVGNLQALQNFDTTQPLTIEWNGLAAATDTDGVSLVISDSDGQVVFSAPDMCAEPPVELAPTATSVTIPAGTFEPNETYEGELSFYSVSGVGESTIDGFKEFAASVKKTRFSLGAPDSSGESSLEFGDVPVQVLQNGDVQIKVRGTLASDQVVGSLLGSSDLRTWTEIASITKVALEDNGGQLELVDSGAAAASPSHRFYRLVIE